MSTEPKIVIRWGVGLYADFLVLYWRYATGREAMHVILVDEVALERELVELRRLYSELTVVDERGSS